MSDVPKHLKPYFDVLDEEVVVKFLLAFGGTPIYLAEKPTLRSDVAKLIGIDRAALLAKKLGSGHVRVPLCKNWLANRLYANGVSVLAIARTLHVEATTVRRWLPSDRQKQLSLFPAEGAND